MLLGLEGAGKTTFLYSNFLKFPSNILKQTKGSVYILLILILSGFNYEQVITDKAKFNIWDIGGDLKVRIMIINFC